MARKKFRKLRVCPILGSPKDLNSRSLPPQEDVLLSVMYEQQISKRNGISAKDILKAAVAAIGEKIRKLWIKLKIPIIRVRCIKKHICQLHSRRRQLLQADAFKIETVNFSVKREKLFDIAFCSCLDLEKLFVSQRI
jgi:hypothetical protein